MWSDNTGRPYFLMIFFLVPYFGWVDPSQLFSLLFYNSISVIYLTDDLVLINWMASKLARHYATAAPTFNESEQLNTHKDKYYTYNPLLAIFIIIVS